MSRESDLPAIAGGTPIRDALLPYGRQSLDESDIQSVVDVLRTDWITQGPKIEEFEKKVAEYCGAKYAVAVSTGTAALHTACHAAGVGGGDEVITTPLTFIATSNALLYQGGTPVFADVDEITLNIDVDEIEARITERTKAIMPVDFAGHPCKLQEIRDLAERHDLIVIEDASHSLGARYRSKRVGSISHLTTFSFHPVKHVTTGEGGMIVTDSMELRDHMWTFRNHGTVRDPGRMTRCDGAWYYEMQGLGYNYRITDFQCALGISQMEKLDGFVEKRRRLADIYSQLLEKSEFVITPAEEANVQSSYHLYVVRLRLDRLRVGRREIFDAMREENIGVQVHYIPVYFQPYYQERLGYKRGLCPRAEKCYEAIISLPLFPAMTKQDVHEVVKALGRVTRYFAA